MRYYGIMQDTEVMAIIKCTAKLLREFRTKPAIEPPVSRAVALARQLITDRTKEVRAVH